MINLSIPQSTEQLHPRITVVGVGGAGGNAVNNMIQSNLEGVEFVVANTDAQAIAQNLAEKKLQLGIGVTQGLGAGSRPDIGRAAAEEVLDEIVSYLEGSHMVFITAGMGGGTGTGAAPIIARAARDQGILTVGVVTKPFHFEGAHRMKTAEAGLNELQQYVDTLIVIPNQNLFRIANEKTTFADAFKMADEVLHSGVRGVTDLMVMPGLINLDFADIRTVMSEMGKAMMGTGEAEGDRRSVQAAEAAISNPLLDDVSMKGARGVLVNITGGHDMTLYEVDEATNRIRDEVDPEANIIFGSTFDESLEGRIRVSVVSTGIDAIQNVQPDRPAVSSLSLVSDRSAQQSGYADAPRGEPQRAGGGQQRGGYGNAPAGAYGAPHVPQRPASQPAAAPTAMGGNQPRGAYDRSVGRNAQPSMPAGSGAMGNTATAVQMDYDHNDESFGHGHDVPADDPTAGALNANAGRRQIEDAPQSERYDDQFIAPQPMKAPPRQAGPVTGGDHDEQHAPSPRRPQPTPRPTGTPAGATTGAGSTAAGSVAGRKNIFQKMTGLLRREDEDHAYGGEPRPAPRAPRAPQPGRSHGAGPSQGETGYETAGPSGRAAPGRDERHDHRQPDSQQGGHTSSPSGRTTAEHGDQGAPAPRASGSAGQRQSGFESAGRGPLPSAEDEQLDIPAFLRRQAN
ncbi:cell division protein FtsZ [Fodinicurvata sp. EGI_FJ10296]|uniref:cell division protein FtsZ n=1 Tax=Fodinicurvata sp. EGI_FJ10296 TaxID=3231908 RepID=UPI003455D2D1